MEARFKPGEPRERPGGEMLGETEAESIRKFCAKDPDGMLFAYGILRGEYYYRAEIDGHYVVPFWSSREDAERVVRNTPDMSGCEVIDLDAVFIVATQFREIEHRGEYVGINWPDNRERWWGRPVGEVE